MTDGSRSEMAERCQSVAIAQDQSNQPFAEPCSIATLSSRVMVTHDESNLPSGIIRQALFTYLNCGNETEQLFAIAQAYHYSK